MCGFRASGYLGFAPGQTFGNCFSPANFEPAACARQQHARYLWENKPTETCTRAAAHLEKITYIVNPEDTRPFGLANPDSLNPGVLSPDGTRLPPPYPMQVDDCFYADIKEYFPRTVAASIIALEDLFDRSHPYQDPPLSLEKLKVIYYCYCD